MDDAKIKRLKRHGWCTSDAADFLQMAHDDIEFTALKMDLARGLRSLRHSKNQNMALFADEIGSTPSRIEKMETADPDVTIDEIILAMLMAGARRPDIAKLIHP